MLPQVGWARSALPAPTRRLLAVGAIRLCAADHAIRRVETRGRKLMLTGASDYLMHGTRFPRLQADDTDARLDEIAELIKTSGQWSR